MMKRTSSAEGGGSTQGLDGFIGSREEACLQGEGHGGWGSIRERKENHMFALLLLTRRRMRRRRRRREMKRQPGYLTRARSREQEARAFPSFNKANSIGRGISISTTKKKRKKKK